MLGLARLVLGELRAFTPQSRDWIERLRAQPHPTAVPRSGNAAVVTVKLHELQAEQVGAQTGDLYEYQYHQAANATLLLLDGNVHSVYCEWHDDFVLETVKSDYEFHQVKTRTKKRGPWRLSEFFGTPRRTKAKRQNPADKTSFFLKMFQTWRQFESSTKKCVLLTDNVLDQDFQALLDHIGASSDATQAASDANFKHIVDTVNQICADLTNVTLFNFLRVFRWEPALGNVEDLQACRAMIADRMMEVSEVDVLHSETRQMTLALVATVRKKSHHTAKTPIDDDVLRSTKAVALPELLNLLSLSPDGYRALKQTGRHAVRTLSRLHRWCQTLGWPEQVIPNVCALKAGWHVWLHANRLVLTQLDELVLRTAVQQMLVGQNRPGGTLENLIAQAKLLSEKYSSSLATTPRVTPEIIVGLAFDMAVNAQGGSIQ